MHIFKIALKNIGKNLKFYVPFLLILIIFAFALTTLLSLALGSSQIYKKSGSKELLAVFESNRACVMASLVPEAYKSRIAKLPHIEDITGEVRHIMVYAPKKSLTIAGVEPDKFRAFKDIRIPNAEYEAFKKDPHGVIIGKKVERLFKWKVGEAVTLQRMNFNIRGVFKLPLSVYNGMIIFHKEYMQKLIKKEGFFTAITIKIDSPKNKSEVSKTVEQLFTDHPSGISCKSETEFWGMTEKQMGDFGKNMRVLTILCALVLFGVIANGAAFCLKRRYDQVKIFKTIGFTRTKIFTIFFIEPLMAVFISGIGGCLLAFFLWIKQPTIGGEHAIIPPIAVTPAVILASLFSMLLIAVISTAGIAYKTSNGIKAK
ncbi:MAG: FtsX-like permease family protein [Desulfobacterales bacterium]|nr:FtsX-like permease family protein [Desulfobacterales bacterium]